MSHPFIEIFKVLGFKGPRDFVSSVYGLKSYSLPLLKIQLSGTLLAALVAFCTKWIWDPPSALFLLLVMELFNTFYGVRVAMKLKHEEFSYEKFCRVFGKLIGIIVVLGMVKNSINSYEQVKVIDFGVFAWIASVKGRKIVSKMVALKVMEGGLPKFIMGLLSSKLGPYLVDTVQGVKPAPTTDPISEPVPPTDTITPIS